MTIHDPIHALRSMIKGHRTIAVFTGAGISTESGIPDFRSPGGIWTKFKPIDFREFIGSEAARREYWQRKFGSDPVIADARPNRGHRAVAHLIGQGRATAVITQNVDGLHQAAGVPENKVIELHGNTTYAKCLSCAAHYALDILRERFNVSGNPPTCDDCGGLIKPATISFGQPMPEAEMRLAERQTLACDLFLVLGSSLSVQPAAGFPVLAKRNGATLAIVNRDATPLDGVADLALHSEIGDTLGAAVGIA